MSKEENMKRFYLVALIVFIVYHQVEAETFPKLIWSQVKNGSDYGYLSLNTKASTVDCDNNIYITGYTEDSVSATRDVFLIKTAKDSTEEWIKFYHVDNYIFTPTAMTTDDSLNVYITGWNVNDSTNLTNAFIMKYDVIGNLKWINHYSATYMYQSELCVDENHNVYIYFPNYENESFYQMTVKYNSGGILQWVITNNTGNDNLRMTLLDSSLIVVGRNVFISGSPGYNLIAYDSAGIKKWESRIDTLSYTIKLKQDGDGNIFVLGRWKDAQAAIVKLQSNGSILWTAIIDSIINEDDIDLYIDSAGNSYFTGTHYYWSGIVMKFDPDGGILWRKCINSSDLNGYVSRSICLDKNFNVVVTGTDYGFDEPYTIIRMFNSVGVQTGTVSLDNYRMNPTLIASNQYFFYLISGEYSDIYNNERISVMCFDTKEDGIDEPAQTPEEFSLYPNYPNPFNPQTIIAYDLPEPGKVNLEVYNLRGQKIRTIVNQMQSEGKYYQVWNAEDDDGRKVASGIYFYNLKIGDRFASKKMILIR